MTQKIKNISVAAIIMLLATNVFGEVNDTLRVRNIEEVVVVSMAKENSMLRQQPLSSTSFASDAVRQQGMTSVKDLSAKVPGLFIPNYGSRLTTSVYVRGVGSRTGTSAVGMYLDGIAMNNMSVYDIHIADADRIDVLRGPQGTLYGRNTMGGLIRVFTKNPMNHEGTDITIGGATFGDYNISATHYHKVSDVFAFSGAVAYDHQGGFYKNAFSGKKQDSGDDLMLRWRGVLNASDRSTVDFSAVYQYTDQNAYPYEYRGLVGVDAHPFEGVLGQISYDDKAGYKRHFLNLGMNADYRWDKLTLNYMQSMQVLSDDMRMDQDFTSNAIYTLNQRQQGQTITEELVLKYAGDRWKWTTGATMAYQWMHTDGPVVFKQDGVDWLENTINGSMPVLPGGMVMSVGLTDDTMKMGGQFETPHFNTAFFHQTDIKIVGGLSATLGLRAEYEQQQIRYDAAGTVNYDFNMVSPMMPINLTGMSTVPAFVGKLSNGYWQVLPKVALEYAIDKQQLYASVSRGFRSGGYNVQMFSELLQAEMRKDMMDDIKQGTFARLDAIAAARPGMPVGMIKDMIGQNMPVMPSADVETYCLYKPESAWNYEVGAHLNLLGGHLQTDVAAFMIETDNLQISKMAGTGMGRITVNAGESRSLGGEISMRAIVTDAFSAYANYGFTHAKFHGELDSYVPFVPRHTVAAGARYEWNTRGWIDRIVASADWTGAGRIYWTEDNSASQAFYGTLQSRLSVSHKNMELGLWGRNLTDTKYDAFYFESVSRCFAQKGQPLQVGVDVRVRM